MVEDTKVNEKNETKTPLLSANLPYPSRPYVAQMPALLRIIGHYTDVGRPMPKAGSPEAETAVHSQQEDEQEQRLVYNKDTQPIEVINPFVRWHRRWYRSKSVDTSPTVGVYYTPFNMALEPWAMGLGDSGCAKIFKQYRMCTHMMPSTRRFLCEDEKEDVKECMLAEKRILRHHYMYQHRVKKNLPFPEDPLVDGIMASSMLRRIFQRSFTQTTFQYASSSSPPIVQQQIIHENDLTGSKNENNSPTVIDESLQHDDYFNVRSMVTLEDLFKNRAHYGHVTGMRNPWMSQYIYGHRLDVDIINLDKTLPMLHLALNFLAHIAYRQGIILFLTRYPAHVPLVERAARDCGEYAHCRKWDYPFTNTQALFGYDIRLPDVCIFTHTLAPPNQLHPAVSDANKLLIPTVALCDTDTNPNIITYPIPSNDDTPKLIEFYLTLFQQAIMAGKEKNEKKI